MLSAPEKDQDPHEICIHDYEHNQMLQMKNLCGARFLQESAISKSFAKDGFGVGQESEN